jgi:hypothetical protein
MRRLLWLPLLLVSSLALAQECTSYVVVAVLDHTTGDEIENLKLEDFTARSGHTFLPLRSLDRKFANRLMVLLETDGASKSEKLSDEVDIITKLARQAPDGKPVSFGVYSQRALFTKEFNPNEKERTAEINGVVEEANSLGKRVALFDSLHEALEHFGPHQPGDTVLLVADPYDDISRHSVGDIEKEFVRTGTRLSVMLRSPLSRVSRDFMWNRHEREKAAFEQLSARTGGAYTIFGADLFRFPWKGYMLAVEVPKGYHPPMKWKLMLRDDAPVWHRHPKLYYPEMLPPCSAPPKPADPDDEPATTATAASDKK